MLSHRQPDADNIQAGVRAGEQGDVFGAAKWLGGLHRSRVHRAPWAAIQHDVRDPGPRKSEQQLLAGLLRAQRRDPDAEVRDGA
eukprot:2195069-Rhodomonas_salina.2